MFKLQRYFSKASVLALLLAAVLIGLLYHLSVGEDLRDAAKGTSAVLARSITNRVDADLHGISISGIDPSPKGLLSDTRIHALADRLARATKDLPVTQVTVATSDGLVLYSTERETIGRGLPPMEAHALKETRSELADGGMGHWLHDGPPGRPGEITTVASLGTTLPNGTPLVLLLTQNMEGLLVSTDNRQMLVLLLGGGVFLALYVFLFQVVRRGERVLANQREEIEALVVRRTRELKESQERMHDVAEASSDWFWESGPDHRFTWFSVQAPDVDEVFDPGVALGHRRLDMVDMDRSDPLQVAAHLDDLEARRPFRDFTYWGLQNSFRDGDPRNRGQRLVRSSGKPRFDEEGRFLGYRGSASDITDQAAVEARAREAERRLSEAIDGIPDGFALWDRNDRLVLWNRAFSSFFPRLSNTLRVGFPFEEAVRLNMGAGDVRVSESEGGGLGGAQGALAIQTRVRRHREADGAVEMREASGRWVLITERRVTDGQVLSIYTDITKRKAAEMELAESEAGLRAFLGITSDSTLSPEERFQRMLEFGTERFGLENGAVLDTTGPGIGVIRALGPVMERARVLPALDDSMAGICARRMEPLALHDLSIDPPKEAAHCVETWGVRAFLGVGLHQRLDVAGVLVFFDTKSRSEPFGESEVSLLELMAQWVGGELARRETDRVVRVAMEQAEMANRTKSEFLANMSHELRTPLNAILGFSEVMAQEIFGPLGGQRYREYAQGIHDSGEHLLAIINDILDVSKIEAGHLVLSEEAVATAPLVDATLRLVASRAREGGVALERDVVEPSPRVLVDARRMKQVLINVLSNAVKFTPKGGKVRIGARASATRVGGLDFVVTDTGVGMDAEDIRVALSPFGQIDSGLARRHEGTGLGLPLAKSLMEMHGGDLVISSVPGQGTEVILSLPPERVVIEDMPRNHLSA